MLDWEQTFDENPQMLWGLVADVVKAVKADEGEKRTGRRPAASCGSIEELYEVLFPTAYASEPFPRALHQALNGRSQRQLAVYAGVSQPTLSRLIAGTLEPDVELIEKLAHALKVKPTWFVEYRALKVAQIVTNALLNDPHLSADAVRRLMGAR